MKLSKKEIAKFQAKEAKRSDGHVANNLEKAGWVRDRKTGEYYDPEARFRELMTDQQVQATLKRLADK